MKGHKNKKAARRFAAAAISLLLWSALISASPRVSAYDDGTLSSLEDYIPDDVRDDLPDGLLSGETDAEDIDAKYIFDKIISYAKDALFPAASLLTTLLGLTVISSSFELLSASISSGKLGACISEITVLFAASEVFVFEAQLEASVSSLITVITTFTTAAAPILAAAELAGGGISGAAVTSYSLLMFSSALELITSYIFVPLYRASLGLAVISAVSFSKNSGAVSVCGFIKRTFTTLLSFAAVIFSAVICCQKSLASASDSFAVRGIKFAAGGSIPIVGGALGDAVTTALSGISIIKSRAGVLGIIVLILTAAPIII
ncbi:MAG: stage III sporulation protein AE, partial [Firmicutes bacterium]|nr:stage III sporulation protein AE [Bacillota bacterium]